MAGEKCERLRDLDPAGFRDRCAEFANAHGKAIASARPVIPAALNDRAADIWEPLLVVADLAGGPWPELAREAALKLSDRDDEMTLIGYFLKDLRDFMVLSEVDRMLSRDIVAALNPAHDRPWEDLRRGREINEWWLGHRMSELGIRGRSLRYGELVGRGYLLQDVEAAFRRYVPNADLHAPMSQTRAKEGV
jgi:putative DNA primase/helicase